MSKQKPIFTTVAHYDGPLKIPIAVYEENDHFAWFKVNDKTWQLIHKKSGALIHESRQKITIMGMASSLDSLGDVWNVDTAIFKNRPELEKNYWAIVNFWKGLEEV